MSFLDFFRRLLPRFAFLDVHAITSHHVTSHQATGIEGLEESDDLLNLGVDSLASVGISSVRPFRPMQSIK